MGCMLLWDVIVVYFQTSDSFRAELGSQWSDGHVPPNPAVNMARCFHHLEMVPRISGPR